MLIVFPETEGNLQFTLHVVFPIDFLSHNNLKVMSILERYMYLYTTTFLKGEGLRKGAAAVIESNIIEDVTRTTVTI